MQIQFSELQSCLLGKKYIIGCDEAGTGSGAGSFFVCGVKAPIDWKIDGLNDSKKLSAKRRDEMRHALFADDKVEFYLAEMTHRQIDEFGLGVCLKDAYIEVFNRLSSSDSLIVCDGTLNFDGMGVNEMNIVSMIKADGLVPQVMGSSIIAKTHRDFVLTELDKQYPEYGFAGHFGYLTKSHKDAIRKFGLCDIHRKSYKIKL